MKKVELLAPAGGLEKLKMAVVYGADAVYIGGEAYSLRASADNFSREEMKEGIEFAHKNGKKVYLTMNIIPHNEDLEAMPEYIKDSCDMGIDAIILSDPGVYSLVKEVAPNIPIHISTQANNTNWRSAKFWYEHGASRIVLARELSLNEMKEIRDKVSEDLELEMFIHGAMCISYSGRCLLSGYMADRDSNKGLCAHPCRWKYHLVEEKRPGEYLPVYENERGTYIFNSKDLCMLEFIPDIINAGITSLKIEGRMKSSFYVATVVKAYREAIDSYYENTEKYQYNPKWFEEISKASHREYTTGFYFNKTTGRDQIYNTSSYVRDYEFIGIVRAYDSETGIATIEQRNRMFKDQEIEVMSPKGDFFVQKIYAMKNTENEIIDAAPHPQMILYMKMDKPVQEFSILRKKR